MQQLQARVAAEHGRNDRSGQIPRQRGVHRRADHVGQPQNRHCDIGPPAAQSARVALDVEAVLGEPVAEGPTAGAVLGEHDRIVGARPVHLGRRLQHDAAHRRRLLTGREKLHRAHHVDFLQRSAATGARRVGRRRGVHHRVDVAVADHLGDERVSDVGADELGAAHPAQHVLAGCDGVDGDDPVDHRVLRQPGGQIPAEEPARTGNQHNLGIVQRIGAST